MKTTKYTFWELMNEYSVEIPIIQRDYAQGREDPKTCEIRNKLLFDLFNAISENNNLDFDFVYGSLISGKFIPLDGQQRLTTLFLLYWYLAMKEDKIEDFRKMLLYDDNSKFAYRTRITARDFCNELVANDVSIPDRDMPLSDKIKDASWFFLSWEKDPTIKSMLVMLDAIHTKFNQCDYFFEKLVRRKKSLITFQFIELDNFGLTDDLYIKMNARGKSLTNFENFKAKFEQLLEKKHRHLLSDFSKKIDGEWTDLFWAYKDNKNLFDEQFLNFFRVMATNNYALVSDEKKSEQNLNILTGTCPIYFSKFQELQCFDDKSINDIINTLDCLKNEMSKIKIFLPDTSLLNELELFEKVIKNSLIYNDRILFYGLTQYLIRDDVGDNNDGLCDWMRIIRNLSVNTLYSGSDEYSRSIKSIAKLLPNGQKILNYISNSDNNIFGFNRDQVTEERIKALLILKDKKWRDSIVQIENHAYFKGQIGFILKFAGIIDFYESNNKNLEWSDEKNNKYYALFNNYSQKAQVVFKDKGLNIEFRDHIWERALLCKGDYQLPQGINYSFLIYIDRDISWKRLLRDDNGKRRNYVKELLDDINIQTIVEDLQKIIDDFKTEDWRTNFIKFPDIIKQCGIKKFIRFKSKGDDILLLEQTMTSGYHREYYSYSLKLKLEEMGNTVRYVKDRSVEYEKYISSINGKEIHISYVQYKETDKWKYKIKIENKDEVFFETEKEVIDYLQTNGYLK